jgi:hypothetical protein
MTTQNQTERMLEPYIQDAPPAGFLTNSFSSVGPNARHNNAKVSVDIRLDDDDVAFPSTSEDGWNFNKRNAAENHEWTPPVYKEAFAVTARDLMEGRAIGENPFTTPVLGTRAQDELNRMAIKLQRKIQNGLEIQASQLLLTGALSITDNTGAVRYSETFGALNTHYPAASVDWDTASSAVPLTDIANLGAVIVADGRMVPRKVTMNSVTFAKMVATSSFQTAMDSQKRMWQGQLDMQPVGLDTRGGVRRGVIFADPFVLEVYTYDATYKHPQTGSRTKFVIDDRYILESGGRLDATFGGLSNFGTDGRGDRYFARINNPQKLSDLSIITWITLDGTAINVGVGGRPLLIPVAINTIGCGKATT